MLKSFNVKNLVEETREHVVQCKGLHGLIQEELERVRRAVW